MFTGIVENLGKMEKKENNSYVFSTSPSFCKKLSKGTSVAINGVCLTVTKKISSKKFVVDVMPETQNKTMFNELKKKNVVNLELPATLSTFLSGHIVQGHVDGVGILKEIKNKGNSRLLKINTNQEIAEFVVKKGSITINGISLTVVDVEKKYFSVAIIPFTWKNTMLSQIKIGEKVNIETDVLGKYLKKFLNK